MTSSKDWEYVTQPGAKIEPDWQYRPWPGAEWKTANGEGFAFTTSYEINKRQRRRPVKEVDFRNPSSFRNSPWLEPGFSPSLEIPSNLDIPRSLARRLFHEQNRDAPNWKTTPAGYPSGAFGEPKQSGQTDRLLRELFAQLALAQNRIAQLEKEKAEILERSGYVHIPEEPDDY